MLMIEKMAWNTFKKTGDINTYAPSDDSNGYGYWLANNSSRSGDASQVPDPNNSDFGFAGSYIVTHTNYGVRPCFML